jgi:transposase
MKTQYHYSSDPLYFQQEVTAAVPEGDLAVAVVALARELDLGTPGLGRGRDPGTRGPKPRSDTLMLLLVLAGWAKGAHSTRALEDLCRSDVGMLWMLGGSRAPGLTTFSRFIKDRLAPAPDALVALFAGLFREMGLAPAEDMSQDGTKMEACANKHAFKWRRSLEGNRAKMLAKASAALTAAAGCHALALPPLPGPDAAPPLPGEAAAALGAALGQLPGLAEDACPGGFAHGTGHRKSQAQSDTGAVFDFLARLAGHDMWLGLMGRRNSLSTTDPDATFMRMKDDHMGNGQLKAAYNLQLVLSTGYVMAMAVTQDATGYSGLALAVALLEAQGALPGALVADSGHGSEENHLLLQGKGIRAFIKPQDHGQHKKKSFINKVGHWENMAYDKERDEFTCAAGKRLRRAGTSHSKSKSGHVPGQAACVCEGCEGCGFKGKPKPRAPRGKGKGAAKGGETALALQDPVDGGETALGQQEPGSNNETALARDAAGNGGAARGGDAGQAQEAPTGGGTARDAAIVVRKDGEKGKAEGGKGKAKPVCTTAAGNKVMSISWKREELRAESRGNILSPEGVELRVNRSIQSEGAFAVLKEDMGFRRLKRRGLAGVAVECALYAVAYNIRLFNTRLGAGRLGAGRRHVKETA